MVSERIGGPYFSFQPYLYGPFDKSIYGLVRTMESAGDLRISADGGYARYSLTQAGYLRGEAILASFPDSVAEYFRRAARWTHLMPYRQMLAAIYRQFPEMARNSVTRHLVSEPPVPKSSPFMRGLAGAFDISGSMNRTADSEVELPYVADALREDWRAVGEDIEAAMVQFGESESIW